MAFAKNRLCGTEKKGRVQNRGTQSAPLYKKAVAKMAARFACHSLAPPPCYIIFLRLCIERVIGVLKQKYTILESILPINMIMCDDSTSLSKNRQNCSISVRLLYLFSDD